MMRTIALTGAAGVTMVAGMLLVTALTSAEPTVTPETDASVVTFDADYPDYSSLDELEARSSLVVEVAFTGDSHTVLVFPTEPDDPTDPEENPTLGVDPSEIAAEPETPPIVTTVHEARVTNVVEGTAQVGQVIEVQELGGTYQGTEYVPMHDAALDTDGGYLLFLDREAADQPFQLLNPDQAAYPETASGELQPLPENDMSVTTDQLTEYVD